MCEKHGDKFIAVWSNKNRCKVCSQERVTEQRRRNKINLVLYFGGKCVKCGYNKCITALTFHHKDPSKKEFGISCGNYKSFAKLVEEAKKCHLLYHNCHSEEHSRPDDFNFNSNVIRG